MQKYHEIFQKEHDNILQHQDIQGSDKAVYTTWKISYDQLDESAKLFFHICSILHHEGIPEELFERFALAYNGEDKPLINSKLIQLLSYLKTDNSSWSSWTFQKIINKLSSYSLLESNCDSEGNTMYRIHPLVQNLGKMIIGSDLQCIEQVGFTILAMSVFMDNNKDAHMYYQKIWPHTLEIKRRTNLTEYNINILENIRLVCNKMGHWKDVEELDLLILQENKEKQGEDHPDTITAMANLASTYWNQGRWNEAESLQNIVLQSRQKILGTDHPDTITAMADLASTYSDQGRWNEAESLQNTVLQSSQKILGTDHPDTIRAMANLATTYSDQGRWNEAESLQNTVLHSSQKILGTNHPDTITAMGNLAIIHDELNHHHN